MTPREALRALLDASPADAMLTVPAKWVAGLLGDQAATSQQDAAAHAIDLTVTQVAERFGRSASTIRTCLERGELPGSYRNHGREWRVPPAAIEAMQAAQANEHRSSARPTSSRSRPTRLGGWRDHLPTQGAQ